MGRPRIELIFANARWNRHLPNKAALDRLVSRYIAEGSCLAMAEGSDPGAVRIAQLLCLAFDVKLSPAVMNWSGSGITLEPGIGILSREGGFAICKGKSRVIPEWFATRDDAVAAYCERFGANGYMSPDDVRADLQSRYDERAGIVTEMFERLNKTKRKFGSSPSLRSEYARAVGDIVTPLVSVAPDYLVALRSSRGVFSDECISYEDLHRMLEDCRELSAAG